MTKPETNGNPLLEWAVDQWTKSVKHRPIVNVHRPALDSSLRLVVKWAGGDPDVLLGPDHYKLAGENWMPALIREQGAVADIEEALAAVMEKSDPMYERTYAALAIVKERYADIL
jgi:hypothetical protein